MRKIKKKISKTELKIQKLFSNDPDMGEDFIEALIEVEGVINGIYKTNLEENILRIAFENPVSKKIKNTVKMMNDEKTKEQYEYQARFLFAEKTVSQFKLMYGINLTKEFKIINNTFKWNGLISNILNEIYQTKE